MKKLLACLVGVVWGLSLISGAFAKEYMPAFDGDVNEEEKECTITPMSYVVLALRRNYDDRLNNICIALYDYYTSAKTYDNYLKSLPSGPDETGILN